MTETLIDSTYEPCAQCDAPLDAAQRYCVFCGASRHHAGDPVARYLAAARRPAAATAPPAVAAGRFALRALAGGGARAAAAGRGRSACSSGATARATTR